MHEGDKVLFRVFIPETNMVNDLEIEYQSAGFNDDTFTQNGITILSKGWIKSASVTTDRPDIFIPDIMIYPNPTAGYLNIQFLEGHAVEVEITLTNQTGQTALIKRIPVSEGYAGLNISSLNKGIYYITIRSDSYIKTEKLVLN
jgi:hypothetical protein